VRAIKEKLERRAGDLEGRGPGLFYPDPQCYRCITLINRKSTTSKLWDLDMHIKGCLKQPNEWQDECQVAWRDEHACIDKSSQRACIENCIKSTNT